MRTTRFGLALLSGILLAQTLGGCRFYGSSATTAGAKVELRSMVEWAEDERGRLEADRQALAAAGLPAAELGVSDLAGRMEVLHASWTKQIEALDGSSSHRDVRRALAGMLSEQHRHEDAYARLVRSLGGGAEAGAARYQVEPTFYRRAHFRADRQGVRDVLQNRVP